MVKIRSDLRGIVILDGEKYRAGDPVPAKAHVGAHLVEPAKESKSSKAPARSKPSSADGSE